MSQVTNKVVVTLNEGVDVDGFILEMSEEGNISQYVPSRPVEIFNLKEDSLYNVDFVMTYTEMEELKKDPRVLDCRWGTKADNGLFVTTSAIDTTPRHFTRSYGYDSGNKDCNWGLYDCLFDTNKFDTYSVDKIGLPIMLDGTGVDVVIFDSGIQVDHPEFQDSNGVSRVKQIDWFTETGVSGSMPLAFYSDPDGHGTNVASIAVGKTYGWAKNADIYVMRTDMRSAISINQGFNLIRIWHEKKKQTGNTRPTIVNCSFVLRRNILYKNGYHGPRIGIPVRVNFKGTNYSLIDDSDVAAINDTYSEIHAGFKQTDALLRSRGITTVSSIISYYRTEVLAKADPIVYNNIAVKKIDGSPLTVLNLFDELITPLTADVYVPFTKDTIINFLSGTALYSFMRFLIDEFATVQDFKDLAKGLQQYGLCPAVDTIIDEVTIGEDSSTGAWVNGFDSSVNSDAKACMSSGVILVGAAGNESYKIDISTGEDYNNSIDILGDISGQVATIKVYYHRGASPTSAGDFITVGAIDYTKGGSLTRSSYSESESMTKAFFSNTGPRVDIYAPGGRIAGAVSSSYSKLNWVPYYLNTSYKSVKMDGTSQASPQVTGVLACALQSNTTLTQGSAKQWLIENSKAKISDSGTNTYTNLFNLQGASNRYLYMPYTYRTTNLTPSMKGGSTTITGPGVSF